MVTSDLSDPDVMRDLLARVEEQRQALIERKDQLETRIRKIQEVVLQHYASGAASVDDWLA